MMISPQNTSRAPQSAQPQRSAALSSILKNRATRLVFLPCLVAGLSTFVGYHAARFVPSASAAPRANSTPALKPASNPATPAADIEAISHMTPQQQAERLLQLAIQRPDQTLGLIHKNLDGWRGHIEDTDQLFHIVLAALDSNDPRVRVAAVEVDLVANNLRKSPQSLEKLRRQIQFEPGSRSLSLWRLGALGNRGVEPATVLATLVHYSRDANQLTRFWAVEGLAMLGTQESISPLLSILAHDPAKQIRERAAISIARSGMLTGEQRLTAVPQLLNLLDDDSLDSGTRDLVFASLQTITGASFGRDTAAWREWWAHHDAPEHHLHLPKNLLRA